MMRRALLLVPLAFALSACSSGATEAECKAAYDKTMESLKGDSAAASKKPDALEPKYIEGCMKSRKKGFGDCVVNAPDAPARMQCTVTFTK